MPKVTLGLEAQKKKREEQWANKMRGIIGRGVNECNINVKNAAATIRRSRATYENRIRDPGKFTLSELRRLDTLLNFTDDEILSMIRG